MRAYAATRKARGLSGGTHRSVAKAIAAGRLERSVVFRDGRQWIDAELADEEWDNRTDPTLARTPEHSGDPTAGRPGGSLEDAPRDDARASSDPAVAEQARAAQAVRLTFQAKLAELEFRQRSGELVRADDVALAQSRALMMVRDRMRALPDKLAPLVAPEKDAHRCRAILLAQVERVLAELERALRSEVPQGDAA